MSCNKKMTFRADGNFRIMQIADTQEIPTVNPDTIKLIRLAVENAKPDLVVFTGDQIYGLLPMFKGNTEKKVRSVFKKLIAPLEENNIPFVVAFGNHDSQCGLSNAQQMKIYMESDCCLGGSYDDGETALGSVPVYGNDGKQILHIYLFDSNGAASAGTYKAIDPQQLEDYRNKRDALFAENGTYIPSLVFQHIPPREVMNTVIEVPKGTKGSVEAFHTYKDRYFVLPAEEIARGGFMGESPAVPQSQSGQFDVLKEKGDVFGIFYGHDHINSFVLPYEGIDLGYTQGTGFNVYGPGRKRGVRIFDIPEHNPREYTTHTVTFGELTDDKILNWPFELIQPIMPTSVLQVKKLIPPVLAAGSACMAAAVGLVVYLKKK